MIVLHEELANAHFFHDALVVTLEEEAALVAKDSGFNNHDAFERASRDFHDRTASMTGCHLKYLFPQKL